MERSSGFLWTAIGAVSLLLLVGAWLGLRAVADAVVAPGTLDGDAAARHARYVAPPDVCPGADALGAAAAVQEQTTLCLLNYARVVEGLDTLATSPALMRSARLKADDIVRCGEFAHDACGHDVRRSFAESGYFRDDGTVEFGENLAWGGAEAGSPRGALLGWLDSPEHRANLFRADWEEHGVALVHAGTFRGVDSSRVWVSHFGRHR